MKKLVGAAAGAFVLGLGGCAHGHMSSGMHEGHAHRMEHGGHRDCPPAEPAATSDATQQHQDALTAAPH